MKIIGGFLLITFIFSPFVWAAETAAISIIVTLEQLEIIVATVEFRPEIIRPRSRYIRCYIELPEPFRVEDINVDTVALTEVNGAAIDPPLETVGRPRIGDFDRDGIPDLRVWFDIRTIIPLLEAGENTLTVTGNLMDGKTFKGTGIIRVIERREREER